MDWLENYYDEEFTDAGMTEIRKKVNVPSNESSENFTYFTFYAGQKEQHNPYFKLILTRHLKT